MDLNISMTDAVLISTFYSVEPFMPAAHAFSPKKIILLIDNLDDKVKANVELIKKTFGNVAQIEVIKMERGNILSVAKKTVEMLEKESSKDKRIIINVSGGWKLLANAVLYGCYARQELIDKIVCNSLDDNSLIELPKLSYGLTKAKRELLEEISTRNGKSISEVSDKLGKSRGMIYQHLKELKENGYVDEKFYITDAGRMALL